MNIIKHETVEVHDVTGNLRNYLEQVSVKRDSQPPQGFVYLHGWVGKDGTKWDLHTREIPV